MNKGNKIGVLVFSFLVTLANPVLSSHVSRMSLSQPSVRGTSGFSIEYGKTNDPWSVQQAAVWNIYGNYSVDLYGIELPLTFSISRDLQDYTHPFSRFGVAPSLGWAKLYAGISRMQLSGISSQGVEFNGAGLELTPGKFRFSGFYGYMAQQNDFSYNGYSSERTKYSAKAFGAKIGIGDDEKHVDLSVFSRETEKDHTGIMEFSRRGEKQSAGMDFGFRFRKGINFSGGFNIIRTLKNNLGWGMESSLDFSAMKGRMNAGVNFFHKSEDETTETLAGINVMLMLERGLIGGNLNFSRMVYDDPGYRLSYSNYAFNGSLMYNRFGHAAPLNLSLAFSFYGFSQEFGSTSFASASMTAGTGLLKSRAMNLSGTAGYNLFASDPGGSRGEIMLSCNLGYQSGNNLFSSYINYNTIPGDQVFLINEGIYRKQNTYRMIAGISWSRSF